MQLIKGHVTMCLAAVAICAGAHAGDHGKQMPYEQPPSSSMRLVAVTATLGEPGHGWQYFSDARHSRAVVISPGGDYYYNHGKGLALVFQAGSAVSAQTLAK